MNEHLSGLESSLERIVDLQESLLALAEAKRDAILRGDIDRMEEILQQEREMIVLVEATEVDRLRHTKALAVEFDLGESPVKLATIVRHAPRTHAERLARLHERLKDIVGQVRHRTRQNAELMKASMEHVEGFLKALAGACAPPPAYGRDGRRVTGKANLLDRSA